MVESCALDVADNLGCTLDEVGKAINLTRERVRQIEMKGLRVVRDMDGAYDGLMEWCYSVLSRRVERLHMEVDFSQLV